MGQLCLSTYLYDLENEPTQQRQAVKQEEKLKDNRLVGLCSIHPTFQRCQSGRVPKEKGGKFH